MANYLIRSCDENSEFVIDDDGIGTLTPTSTYYFEFTGETNSMCYTVISGTEDPATEGINVANKYDDCLTCLQDNNFSFFVTSCDIEGFGEPVSSLLFNEFPLGQYYKLCADVPEIFLGCLCFQVIGIIPEFFEYNFGIIGPYGNCEICLTKTANTIYNACVICCPCESGETITSVAVPHPTFTDLYGNPVIQGNAVLIGGNGLNS